MAPNQPRRAPYTHPDPKEVDDGTGSVSCRGCNRPTSPANRVTVALGVVWHPTCYGQRRDREGGMF